MPPPSPSPPLAPTALLLHPSPSPPPYRTTHRHRPPMPTPPSRRPPPFPPSAFAIPHLCVLLRPLPPAWRPSRPPPSPSAPAPAGLGDIPTPSRANWEGSGRTGPGADLAAKRNGAPNAYRITVPFPRAGAAFRFVKGRCESFVLSSIPRPHPPSPPLWLSSLTTIGRRRARRKKSGIRLGRKTPWMTRIASRSEQQA